MNRFAFVMSTVLVLAGMAIAIGALVIARGVKDEEQAFGAGFVLILGAAVFAMLARARTVRGPRPGA